MNRVVFEQMGVGRGIAQVVDGDELQAVLLVALVVGAKDIASDPPETVDRYFDGHVLQPFNLTCS
jgi:hypothetical protein